MDEERVPYERHVIVSFLWLTGSWFRCNVNYCYNLKSAVRGGCMFWDVALKLAFPLGLLQGAFRSIAVVGSDWYLRVWWEKVQEPSWTLPVQHGCIFLTPSDHSTSVWTISLSL